MSENWYIIRAYKFIPDGDEKMIAVGIAAAAVGVGEFLLDVPVFRRLLGGDYLRAALFLLLKLIVYALGFTLLFVFGKDHIVPAAVGYGAGFFPCLFVYGALSLKKKGEEKKE